ncbi:hypothetical protein [Neisseria sp. S1]|uniref:hypothetical protein n=1 Tax=Neisseria sp. S1 TaxID=3318354 RepID=UPI003A8963D3
MIKEKDIFKSIDDIQKDIHDLEQCQAFESNRFVVLKIREIRGKIFACRNEIEKWNNFNKKEIKLYKKELVRKFYALNGFCCFLYFLYLSVKLL